MKNTTHAWTMAMIFTTPFWAYLLLPFFMSAILSPPGTKSGSYVEELKSPKTPQHYLDRGSFALDKPTNKQVVKKALADCQMAEKLALEEKYHYYSHTFLCQSLAHAYLGNGAFARKLVARSVTEQTKDGKRSSLKLAKIYETDYLRWIRQIEAKPPLPEKPSPYGLY